ncbi:MAG: hypothetical protein M3P23_12125 [Actinomycetota bacterium]|nr:hypothetical protein [Actinomycetota bacterium]
MRSSRIVLGSAADVTLLAAAAVTVAVHLGAGSAPGDGGDVAARGVAGRSATPASSAAAAAGERRALPMSVWGC